MDKIILVNKEKGYTSFEVVRRLKKTLNIKKIGHCGTLDPLAEGLLVVVTGKYCKAARLIENAPKEYIATITFGKNSVTQDAEGPFDKEKEVKEVSLPKIKEALKKYTGKIKQTPPIYSALKKDGKRLYEYARNNEEVDIKEREVEIKELELLSYDVNTLTFRCVCSKGTYIRTLGVDIASYLGNLGYISKLTRTKIGNLKIEDAYLLEDIEKGNYKSINLFDAISGYKIVKVNKEEAIDIKNGKTASLKEKGEYIVIDESNNVIALCKDNKIIRGLF